MYYIYIIKSGKDNIYIGYTSDIDNRVREHNSNMNKSTSSQKWILVYFEAYLNKEDALKRERRLKSHGNSKRFLYQRLEKSLEVSEFN